MTLGIKVEGVKKKKIKCKLTSRIIPVTPPPETKKKKKHHRLHVCDLSTALRQKIISIIPFPPSTQLSRLLSSPAEIQKLSPSSFSLCPQLE